MAQSSPEFNLSILVNQSTAINPDAPQSLILDGIARFAGMTGNIEMLIAALEAIYEKNPRLAQALIDNQQGHSKRGVLIN